MSFSKYQLSKTWESAEDFPTYEDDESQVRADLQYLFDELKDDLNNHVDEEIAENVLFPYSEDIPAYNVRGAIEELKGQLDAAVYETVMPDNSVTTPKLVDANVTTAKIADAGVTTAKIADANVTTGKLADSAVATTKLADGAVTNAKVAAGTLTKDKIADGQVAKLTDGRIDPAVLPLAAAVVSANKTLAATDNGYFFRITDAVTITVPVNGSVSLPVGFEVQLLRYGSGAVTLDMTGCSVYVANSSVAISSYNMSKYEFVTLKKLSPQTSNLWSMTGSAFIPADKIDTAQIKDGAITDAKLPIVPITKGGTGSTTAADARTALEVTPANIGAVPTTREVNGYALSADVTLDYTDVGAAPTSHGTHVNEAGYGSSNPEMDGTASAGSATTLSRSDHVHPSDTYANGFILDAANIYNSVGDLPAAGTAGRIAFVVVS